jgi:hypothetical protein
MANGVGWHSSLQGSMQDLDTSLSVSEALLKQCHDVFVDLAIPELAESKDVKLATYHHYFADALPCPGVRWKIHGYLRKCQPYDSITKVSRFRLSSHYLQVEVGRWLQLERGLRFCVRPGCFGCGSVLDDEYHAFFVCGAFDHIRAQVPFFQVLQDPCFLQFRPWFQHELPLFSKLLKLMSIC